jgi:hypothetical protein
LCSHFLKVTPPEEPTQVVIGVPCSGGVNPSTLGGSSLGINQASEAPLHTSIQISGPEPQQQQQQQVIPQSSHHLQGTIV